MTPCCDLAEVFVYSFDTNKHGGHTIQTSRPSISHFSLNARITTVWNSGTAVSQQLSTLFTTTEMWENRKTLDSTQSEFEC